MLFFLEAANLTLHLSSLALALALALKHLIIAEVECHIFSKWPFSSTVFNSFQ